MGEVDFMSALLFVWGEEELELAGLEVFPALLETIRAQVPGELETTFGDQERLPACLFADEWTGTLTVAELLRAYREHLDTAARRGARAITGLRCLLLLLFAFDTRVRRLMWGKHGVHAITGTRDFDSNPRVRETACAFVVPIKEHAGVFVADILLANQCEMEPGPVVARLSHDFYQCACRIWALSTDALPWPSVGLTQLK